MDDYKYEVYTCHICNGTGESNAAGTQCFNCNGTGEIEILEKVETDEKE